MESPRLPRLRRLPTEAESAGLRERDLSDRVMHARPPELEYSDLVEWPREVLSGSRLDRHRRLPPVRQRSTRRSQLRACASNFSTRHWRAQTSPISALASRVARW